MQSFAVRILKSFVRPRFTDSASLPAEAEGCPETLPARISIVRGRIAAIIPLAITAVEAAELPIAAPGLLDLQVNGWKGIWFSSESLTIAEVEEVIHEFLRQGVTRCLPTLITNSREALRHGLQTLKQARERCELVRRVVAGCHVEGPFISSLDGPRGAHPLRHVRNACVRELEEWQAASGGLVRLVTLAPEVPGAEEFIRQAVASGITVSIGHTAAAAAQIRHAADLGATLSTHLGNGCASMIHRHDNPFWPQLADDRLTCSVIADGWHVPGDLLKCALSCKSPDRLVLTSDVSGFGGSAPGRHRSGDVEVDVLQDGRIVVAGQSQFLAGSGATTLDCVSGLRRATGAALSSVWHCASITPARVLGLPPAEIAEGAPATITLFHSSQDQDRRPVLSPHSAMIDGIVFAA